MSSHITYSGLLAFAHYVLVVVVLLRVLLRPYRDPASRVAWVVVILALPFLGIVFYVLFGEVHIGRKATQRKARIAKSMPTMLEAVAGDEVNVNADVPPQHEHLFRVASSINGLTPVGGNQAELMTDSNATIASMVKDIDAAREHVHLLFYIWLTDNNGLKVVEAVKRAASRGVHCRAMVDGLGSRSMTRSPHWRSMADAGAQLAVALPIGNPLLRALFGRIDVRNHRKIVVVDGVITYCGSQNCADPEFRVKPKYAPWVDAVVRFEGPVARQNQLVFATDWIAETGENLDELTHAPVPAPRSGLSAQVVATGPTGRYSAMTEMFESMMFAARRELIITTPYYVPDDGIQGALCAAVSRGVKTVAVFPARNDSWIVAAASRSRYAELLEAGVEIYEYGGGLLHTKSVTVDGEVCLIGSANMDRRSFDLNYENNILLHDPVLTTKVRERQLEYVSGSTLVDETTIESWSMRQRLWNNTIATVGPIL